MGTYNPFFQGNVPQGVCPSCGEPRPLDWFGPEVADTKVDKHTGRAVVVRRRRKHAECWKCRNRRRVGGRTEAQGVMADDFIG